MKRMINVVMAVTLMLTVVPMQGFAEEIIVEGCFGTETPMEDTIEVGPVNELAAEPVIKIDGREEGETETEDVEIEGVWEEDIKQEQTNFSEMSSVPVLVGDMEAFDEMETEAAFVQNIDVVETECFEDTEMLNQVDDGIMPMSAEKVNVLDVNKTYKFADLDRTNTSVKKGFEIEFTTSGVGRVKINIENTQSPKLYSFGVDNNSWIGYEKPIWDIESVHSNWFSVKEGDHPLHISYDSSHATETEATITILYEAAGEYEGETEPNNSYDTATELKFGVPCWGNKDSIDRYNDYFSFELDKPDQVEIVCDGCDADLWLEDTNRNVYYLTYLDYQKYRLKEGKYYISISGGDIEYTVKVTKSGETADVYEQENNNLSSKANLVNCNAWYTGNIDEYTGYNRLINEDIDWFCFDIPEKSIIQLKTQIPRQVIGSLSITLHDGALSELAKIDTDSNPYKETDSMIVNPGAYYVKIEGKTNYSTWDYSVCLSQKKIVPVTEIRLPSTLKIMTGTLQSLSVRVLPDDASIKTVRWTSSDEKVATVNESGLLATGSVHGKATITAEATDGSGVVGVCNVVVGDSIVYKLNGGQNDSRNPDTYYEEKITFNNPTRKGYCFKGWYTFNGTKNVKIESIDKTYVGTLTLSAKWEKIKLGKATVRSLKNSKKKKAVLRFKKVKGAEGYEIVYGTSKKLNKNTKTITTKKLSATLKNLAKKKTYYVKVRAYKKDSTGAKVYGKYSKVKKVKIKK